MASKNRLVKGEIRSHCWSPKRDRTLSFVVRFVSFFCFSRERSLTRHNNRVCCCN
jgi:hypothetical protein